MEAYDLNTYFVETHYSVRLGQEKEVSDLDDLVVNIACILLILQYFCISKAKGITLRVSISVSTHTDSISLK